MPHSPHHFSLLRSYRLVLLAVYATSGIRGFHPVYRHKHRHLVETSGVTFLGGTRRKQSEDTKAEFYVSSDFTSRGSSSALFGIKGFRSWFESQFPESIVNVKKDSSRESFDHVLIDLNQILHVVLRKSTSDNHALFLLFKELDAVTLMAKPTTSLVLAMDGPPPTAKLATQRRRRLTTVIRSNWKLQHFDKFAGRFSKNQAERKKKNYRTEIRSLQITPGTDFMIKAEEALYYWAWQRMQKGSRSHITNVRFFISPSTMPGEGEVKLLDWVIQAKIQPGSTIAILGGDADLVLESMAIPPHISHNVFVLIPDVRKAYASVSIWETTRALERKLPKLSPQAIMYVRNDWVLTLILNGNDYLPSLRGSKGFNNIWGPYLQLVKEWPHIVARNAKATSISVNGEDNTAYNSGPFLVDPQTLEYNVPFCVEFFKRLARTAPFLPRDDNSDVNTEGPTALTTALNRINNLIDAGFLPKPIEWTFIHDADESESSEGGDSDIEDDEDQDEWSEEKSNISWDEHEADSDDDWDDNNDEKVESSRFGRNILVKLTLGDIDSDDWYQYELWHPRDEPELSAKLKLSLIALNDILGTADDNGDENSKDDEEDGSLLADAGFTLSSSYPWELQRAADMKVDSYLGGLLWNMQTYEDGVCADYAFNYGRRLAPTAKDVLEFFEDALANGKVVSKETLLGNDFTPAVSAGISCLAALPSQVQELVPEPYRWIPSETVDDFYGQCMSLDDNVFDIKRFEFLCESEIKRLKKNMPEVKAESSRRDPTIRGRPIPTGGLEWTVLERTQICSSIEVSAPPIPFSDRMGYLKADANIRVETMKALNRPRERKLKGEATKSIIQGSIPKPPKRVAARRSQMFINSDLRPFMNGHDRLAEVPFKKAYQAEQRSRRNNKRKSKMGMNIKVATTVKIEPATSDSNNNSEEKRKADDESFEEKQQKILLQMKEEGIALPPTDLKTNKNEQVGITVVKQLEDVGMIAIKWEIIMPSESKISRQWPGHFENIRLTITAGRDDSKSIPIEATSVEMDRLISKGTRRAYRHHLACEILDKMIGPSWTDMTIAQIRESLANLASQRKRAG